MFEPAYLQQVNLPAVSRQALESLAIYDRGYLIVDVFLNRLDNAAKRLARAGFTKPETDDL